MRHAFGDLEAPFLGAQQDNAPFRAAVECNEVISPVL